MNHDDNMDRQSVLTVGLKRAALFLAFIGGYYALGVVGLQLQSAQTGISPVWPASGLALAMVYWFGWWLLPAILPAMLLLGWQLGVPLEIAAISAIASMLEAGVPTFLMRRAGVDPGLRHLRDALMFVAMGPLLGPVFSATGGSLAFILLGGSGLDLLRMWLLWWLGNSVGILLVGGFGLVMVARRSLRVTGRRLAELAAGFVVVVLVTTLGMLQVVDITSPLVLFLLIPAFVLIAQRGDQLPVLTLGMSALCVILLASLWLPRESLAQTRLGIIYLDISLLWVVTFTGMIVSSARQEMNAREHVTWLARHDPLTRLVNRHAFMERLEEVLPRVKAKRSSCILLFLDLDRFKDLNDAEGHRAGDRVLRDVGVLLSEEVRAVDTVARLGGDEFAVILEEYQLLDACAIAENIRTVVERYEYTGTRGLYRVEVSIGLVPILPEHASPEDVLHAADGACYEAKRGGRNRVWVGSDGDDVATLGRSNR